ncbi:MAG: hypothetical protein EYC70_05995 [Planctomycetota bacterium]|nr:MAG: hypothetical protein EYC70_05995 [Planctomycetota bacterium]
MRIDLKTAQILTSDEARETLALFSNHGDDPLSLQESFRGLFPKKTAEALGELTALRRRGAQKFSRGLQMFFTREQLEQASSERVAAYRAERMRKAGFHEVWDPCCGIGADAIALAAAGLAVHAWDKDPSAVHFARANAEVCGAGGIEFREADCTTEMPGPGAIFIDPSRRKGSRRLMSPDEWSPKPADIARLLEGRPGACVKLSPAVPLELLLAKFPAPGEIETISLSGEAKETLFWYGACASGVPRRATLLPAGDSYAGAEDGQAPVGELAEYVYDPDPAVVRSGLLGALAKEHGLCALDPEIAYLTGKKKVRTPFLDAFRVVATEALDPRKMRSLLRDLQVGRLEVRKRGVTDRPLTMEQKFLPRAFGERTLTLIACRIGERHLGILAEPVS